MVGFIDMTLIYASLFAPILIFAVVGFRKGAMFTLLSLLVFNIAYQISVVATPFVYILVVSLLPFLASTAYPYVYVTLLGLLYLGGVRLTFFAIGKISGSVRFFMFSRLLTFIDSSLRTEPSLRSSILGGILGLVWGLLVTVAVFYLITIYYGV